MVLSDGVAYVEVPKKPCESRKYPCEGCIFEDNEKLSLCENAEDNSYIVFGGNCDDRNVIYIKADPQPVKE